MDFHAEPRTTANKIYIIIILDGTIDAVTKPLVFCAMSY